MVEPPALLDASVLPVLVTVSPVAELGRPDAKFLITAIVSVSPAHAAARTSGSARRSV
jgi:hypothetical protein